MKRSIVSRISGSCWRALSAALLLLFGTGARAADAPASPAPPFGSPWSVTVTPYAWLTSLKGTQTVRGRTVNVDETFLDLVHDTIGKGGQLFAVMGNAEVRYGPFAFLGDLVWTQLGIEGGGVAARSIRPGIAVGLGATGDLKIKMAIAEAAGAYELARFGFPFGTAVSIPAAFDVLAGARYWYQEADLSLNVAATVDVADLLVLGRDRAIARSGSVDWTDPFVGARLRLALAPGHQLFIRGDVGGFGVGSRSSWQAVGGYTFDFAVRDGVTFSGLVGYKALQVDYVQGERRRRYEFDMVQHGPVVGLSLRW